MNSPRAGVLILCGWMALTLSACQPSAHVDVPSYETTADPPRRNAQRARELHEQALRHVENDEYEAAERLLKAALEADVTFAPAHNNLGLVYFHQGKLYEAAWEFQYAANLMTDRPEPRNNLGLVLEAAGRIDQAMDSYSQAMGLAPDNPQYIGNLVRARLRRGDRDVRTRELLEQLIFKDTRPDWLEWARQQLAVMQGPVAPPGSAQPGPTPEQGDGQDDEPSDRG